jgi:hypothetical protein
MSRHVTTRFAGLVILIAGLWGGLVPFVGPYFHFALGPNHSWTWTSGRFYLSVLPAIAAILGGVILLSGGPRVSGRIGALLAIAGGVWFAIGPTISLLWASDAYGLPRGHKGTRMLELLTYHTGLGVLIATFAAYALPGYVALRRTVAVTPRGAATGAAATEAAATRPAVAGSRGAGPVTAATAAPATAPGARTTATPATDDEQPGARRRWFGMFGRRGGRAVRA